MSEIDRYIQSGPCQLCGATNYPLSMGGPTICPSCDCSGPVPSLQWQLQRAQADIVTLREENHKLKGDNCEMARLVDTLRQQLAAAENTILELRHELTETWTRTDGQRTRLEKQREVLRYALKRMWEHYSMAASGRDYLEPRLISCEQQRDTLKARVKELEMCNQLNATEMQRYQIQSARVESRRDTLTAELERVYAHNHDLEDAIAMGEQTVETLTARVAAARTERDGWKETARQYAENTGYWQTRAEAAGRELATARGQIEAKDRALQWIASHSDDALEQAATLHWDMRGKARAALANGTEPPNCARCRRDDCWPDCARFYDKPGEAP